MIKKLFRFKTFLLTTIKGKNDWKPLTKERRRNLFFHFPHHCSSRVGMNKWTNIYPFKFKLQNENLFCFWNLLFQSLDDIAQQMASFESSFLKIFFKLIKFSYLHSTFFLHFPVQLNQMHFKMWLSLQC